MKGLHQVLPEVFVPGIPCLTGDEAVERAGADPSPLLATAPADRARPLRRGSPTAYQSLRAAAPQEGEAVWDQHLNTSDLRLWP